MMTYGDIFTEVRQRVAAFQFWQEYTGSTTYGEDEAKYLDLAYRFLYTSADRGFMAYCAMKEDVTLEDYCKGLEVDESKLEPGGPLFAVRYRGCPKGAGEEPMPGDEDVGKIYLWTMGEILNEINLNRSSGWKPYDQTDWKEGLDEWTWYEPVEEEAVWILEKLWSRKKKFIRSNCRVFHDYENAAAAMRDDYNAEIDAAGMEDVPVRLNAEGSECDKLFARAMFSDNSRIDWIIMERAHEKQIG